MTRVYGSGIRGRVRYFDAHRVAFAVDPNSDRRAAVLDRVRDEFTQHQEQRVNRLDMVPARKCPTRAPRLAGARHHCWQQDLHCRHGRRFLTAGAPTIPVPRRSPSGPSPIRYPGLPLRPRNRLGVRTACPLEGFALHQSPGSSSVVRRSDAPEQDPYAAPPPEGHLLSLTDRPARPNDTGARLVLEDQLDVTARIEFSMKASEVVRHADGRVGVDCSAIHVIDEPLIGLLTWLTRNARQRGLEVVLERPTPSLLAELERAGVIDRFVCDQA